MRNINFNDIKIGDTILSDVYRKPSKIFYRNDNRVFFFGRHPVSSELLILYWYQLEGNEIILCKVGLGCWDKDWFNHKEDFMKELTNCAKSIDNLLGPCIRKKTINELYLNKESQNENNR